MHKSLLTLTLATATLIARADFFQGNREDSYSASGQFSLVFDATPSGSKSITIPTHSGPFEIGHGASLQEQNYWEWELYVDFRQPINAPAPAPWEHLDFEWSGPPLNTIAVPGSPFSFTATFNTSVRETYTLGSYSVFYETLMSVPADISYDGETTFSMSGTWTYSSVLLEETGRRPDAVPEGGPLAAIAIPLLGFALVRRLT